MCVFHTRYVMTGLDKIISEIQQDAERNAANKLDEAGVKAQEILTEARALEEKVYTENLRSALEKSEDAVSRAKSAAELETRRLVLAKKQELIAKTVEAARLKLEALPDAEYFDMLVKLLEKNTAKEKGKVQLSSRDLARLPADFEEKLPKNLTLLKRPGKGVESGFLLIYGGIDVNCSLEALFAAALEELQDKAASILFQN